MSQGTSKPKRKVGQVITPIIILIMGLIMVPAGLLQQPFSVIAVMFGFACIALGVGALYFYNQDKKKEGGLS